MSKSLRLSEKWFRAGLWVVAVIFASFLIGLGGTIVRNMPKVENDVNIDQFVDPSAAARAKETLAGTQKILAENNEKLSRLQLEHQKAKSQANVENEKLKAWQSTQEATKSPKTEAELASRTSVLDKLKSNEQKTLEAVQEQQKIVMDIQQENSAAQRSLSDLRSSVSGEYQSARRGQELRVFGYRLLLTLPLLALAGWLFVKKRKGTYWPFVWGFIIFATFTFFFELVPYLPSYGGYVRYAVGILVTFLIGRFGIKAMNRYLERQRLAESMPDAERRKVMGYDEALVKISKKVCPGCERPVDFSNTTIDFCPHCGICIFNKCTSCETRKSAFANFCHACGSSSATQPQK